MEWVIEPESAKSFLVFVLDKIPFSITRSEIYPPVTKLTLLAAYKRAFNSPFCGGRDDKAKKKML